MNQVGILQQEIHKAEALLVEARENYEKNPDDYSGNLLLLSVQNHLVDLYKKLDLLLGKEG